MSTGGEIRRKRWVSERYARTTGRETTDSRGIEIWCEAQSHQPVFIGQVDSYQGPALLEMWKPSGPHLTTERLVLTRHEYANRVNPDLLINLGAWAERHRFLCPSCGLDVLAGDRLGHKGMRALWETQDAPGTGDPQSSAAAEKTDSLLSKVADAGVSRLSLAAFGHILSM